MKGKEVEDAQQVTYRVWTVVNGANCSPYTYACRGYVGPANANPGPPRTVYTAVNIPGD